MNDFCQLENKSRSDFDTYMKSLEVQFIQDSKPIQKLEQPAIESAYEGSYRQPQSNFMRYRNTTPEPRYIERFLNSSPSFPRSITYSRNSAIPSKTLSGFPSRSVSPITGKVYPYIPTSTRRSNAELSKVNPLVRDSQTIISSSVDQSIGMKRSPTFFSERGPWINTYSPYLQKETNLAMTFGNKNQNQNELMKFVKERKKGRKRSPFYFRALQEVGGVEDAIEGLEESLYRNELNVIQSKYRATGYKPWHEYRKEIMQRDSQNYQRSPNGNFINHHC